MLNKLSAWILKKKFSVRRTGDSRQFFCKVLHKAWPEGQRGHGGEKETEPLPCTDGE